MKKTLALVALLAAVFSARGQCPINTVSTDYNNYDNSADPSGALKFDWEATSWTAYKPDPSSGAPTAYTLNSPFFDLTSNPNIAVVSDPVDKDYRPEDGWEFVIKNFGTTASGQNNPYFILYNRYSGILRCFVNITNSGDPQTGATLSLKFNGVRHSAALNQLGSVTRALDAFESGKVQRTPNVFINSGVNSGFFWLFADFPVMYDPCSCSYASSLVLQAELIENVSVTLHAAGTTRTVVTNSSGQAQVNNGSFFSRLNDFLKDGTTLFKDANTGFKNGTEMRDNAIQFVDNNSGLLGTNTTNTFKTIVGRLLFEAPKVNLWVAGATTLISLVKKWKTGQTADQQLSSTQVTESQSSIDITGSITGVYNFGTYDFALPGSDQSATPAYKKPAYNNDLGVFNLIETPKAEFVEYTPEPWITLEEGAWLRHVKIKSPLKYTVNPAANVVIKNIEACLVYDVDAASFVPVSINWKTPSGTPTADQLQDWYIRNGYTIEYNPSSNTKTLSTPYVHPGCFESLSVLYYSWWGTTEKKINNLRCRVKVELAPANPAATSDVEGTVLILSYPITDISVSPLYDLANHYYTNTYYEPWHANTVITSLDNVWPTAITGQIENLELENEAIDRNHTALNTIRVKTGVTNSSTVVVRTLTAGQSLLVIDDGSVIPNNFLLTIGNSNPCNSNTYAEATSTEISAVCGSGPYIGLTTARIGREEPAAETAPAKELTDELTQNYPNPVGGAFTEFYYTVAQDGPAHLTLTDIAGKIIETLVNEETHPKGLYKVTLPVDALSNGTYFISLTTSNGVLSKRMVIAR